LLIAATAAALLCRLPGCVTPRRRRAAYAWRLIATPTRIIALAGTAVALASLYILTSSHLGHLLTELNPHP
jgi:hypothetical protein